MKRHRPVYSFANDHLQVSLSFYRLTITVTRAHIRLLRLVHGDDYDALFAEVVSDAGMRVKMSGADGYIVVMGEIEFRVTSAEVVTFVRKPALVVQMPPDVAFRMKALCEMQERWKSGYDSATKDWIVDTVLIAWNAPVLARQCFSLYAAGAEPFGALTWRLQYRDERRNTLMLVWCGYSIPVWFGLTKKLKPGPYLWTSKGYKKSMSKNYVRTIRKNLLKYTL